MGKLKYLFTSFLFLLTNVVFAQTTGCFITGDNVIYTRDTGVNGDYYVNFILDVYVSGPHPIYDSPLSLVAPACPRAVRGSSTNVRCIINKYSRGTIYNYIQLNPPIQCPIDDYIWLLILPFGTFTYFYYRYKLGFPYCSLAAPEL